MRRRDFAFIIVAYHPSKDAMRRLLLRVKDYPAIVVDNGGTLTFDDVKSATLLTQSANIGFGAAANVGIRYASARGVKWFILLNQDVQFGTDAVRALVAALKKLPPSVAGPTVGALDPKRWTTINPSDRADYVTGSCMAIHEKVVSKTGYFYEPYFLYYEDADYSVRARQAGFPIIRIALVGIKHEETATLKRGSEIHQYYLARNHLLFVHCLAPRPVKTHEVLRMPLTLLEHRMRRERGALAGVRDFALRRFGEIRKGTV